MDNVSALTPLKLNLFSKNYIYAEKGKHGEFFYGKKIDFGFFSKNRVSSGGP